MNRPGRPLPATVLDSVVKTVTDNAWKALLVWCLVALPASAQSGGSISGTVFDPSGATIADASVLLVETATGRQISGKTNSAGHYDFSSLPDGRYTVKITVPGFRTFEETTTKVTKEQALHLDAKLVIGSMSSTVEVSALERPYTALASSAGTRTNTPLIEVPQSVEVLDRALIQDQDRRTLADALVNVSGVVPTKSEEILFTSPLVRGFPAEIYSDGLSTFGNTTTADDPTSLVGLERIDVVKGPNSTMYGGGLGSPLGGLIDLVSERPEPGLEGYVALRGGSFGTVNPYGDVNIPISAKIAARLAGEYQRNDSWVDVLSGDHWSLQPSISFQLSPNTDLFVQGRFNHRDQLEYSGIPAVQALAGQIDRNAFPGAPVGQPHTRLDSRMVTLNLDHTFTDSLRWNTSARYYYSQANEHGSFILPSAYPPDSATPIVYPILTLDMSNNPTCPK